jgi:hypothetical protein
VMWASVRGIDIPVLTCTHSNSNSQHRTKLTTSLATALNLFLGRCTRGFRQATDRGNPGYSNQHAAQISILTRRGTQPVQSNLKQRCRSGCNAFQSRSIALTVLDSQLCLFVACWMRSDIFGLGQTGGRRIRHRGRPICIVAITRGKVHYVRPRRS